MSVCISANFVQALIRRRAKRAASGQRMSFLLFHKPSFPIWRHKYRLTLSIKQLIENNLGTASGKSYSKNLSQTSYRNNPDTSKQQFRRYFRVSNMNILEVNIVLVWYLGGNAYLKPNMNIRAKCFWLAINIFARYRCISYSMPLGIAFNWIIDEVS